MNNFLIWSVSRDVCLEVEKDLVHALAQQKVTSPKPHMRKGGRVMRNITEANQQKNIIKAVKAAVIAEQKKKQTQLKAAGTA